MNSIMNENEYIKNGTMIIFFSLVVCEHIYPVLCHTGEKHLRYGIPRIIDQHFGLKGATGFSQLFQVYTIHLCLQDIMMLTSLKDSYMPIRDETRKLVRKRVAAGCP